MSCCVRGADAVPALGRCVALAWADVTHAGLRALNALEPAEGCTSASFAIDVDRLPTADAAAELRVFRDASGPVCSLLALKHEGVSGEQQAALAAAAHTFAVAGGASLVLLAAVRLPHDKTECVFAYAVNGASSGGRPLLDASTPVSDGVAAALLLLSAVEGTPTLALLAHALRPRGGAPGDDVAQLLATAAAGALGCGCGRVAAPPEPQLGGPAPDDAPLLYV